VGRIMRGWVKGKKVEKRGRNIGMTELTQVGIKNAQDTLGVFPHL
jgi:hypothetical protein